MSGQTFHRYKLIILISVIVISANSAVRAQHDPYEVLFNGIPSDEADEQLPATSEELFLKPLSGRRSLFGEITGLGFSTVRYSRRGLRSDSRSVMLFGTELSGNLNSSPSYGLWSALGRSRLEMNTEQDADWYAGTSAVHERIDYGFNPDIVPERTSVGIFTTDRRGRLGAKVSVSGYAAGNWLYSADIYRRWGRDGTVNGVFTDKTSYSVSLSRLFGDNHSVTVFSAGEDSEDGLRSYITAEAAELRGDNYYNPSWGYQDGKVRNSRVSRGFVPVTALSYRGSIRGKTVLTAAVTFRTGNEGVSGLSWLDAATPYPDYYRFMPTYATSVTAAETIARKWSEGDPGVTQIDWNNLYGVNSMNRTTSVYTLSERMDKVRDIQGFAGARFRVDESTILGISLRSRSDNVRRYRRMKDLLGGIAPEDIDQYLYEDEIYGDRTLNNLREPNRKVNEGDRFGYDYDIFATQAEGLLSARYSADGLTVSVVAGFGYTTFMRRGNYEKEIYPGELSYGKSDRITYETYSGEVSFGYSFDGMHSLGGYVHGGRTPQRWGTHFVSPAYSNKLTDQASPVTTAGGEAGYMYRGRRLRAAVSLYYTATRGRNELYNYWDDISSVYTSMHLRGIGKFRKAGRLLSISTFIPDGISRRGWPWAAISTQTTRRWTFTPRIRSRNILPRHEPTSKDTIRERRPKRSSRPEFHITAGAFPEAWHSIMRAGGTSCPARYGVCRGPTTLHLPTMNSPILRPRRSSGMYSR